MLNIFDAAYLAISPLAAAAIASRYFRHGKYRESAPAMLGMRLKHEDPAFWAPGTIWIHAVSVGEVAAARTILPHLREIFPSKRILLTTHTETGQAAARALDPALTDGIRYFPVDFSWLIRKYARVYRPEVFILMETELWPNTLRELARAGTRIFVFNGKVSERSFGRYQKVRILFQPALRCISAFGMQTRADARRMQNLCQCPDRIHVTGNVKFDIVIPPVTADEASSLREQLGIPPPAKVVVAGSTHRGEEEIILSAWKSVDAAIPASVLVLAPRHPERFDEAWNLVRQSGLSARRVSTGETTANEPPRVILLDRMGILARVYGISQIAIVAGSFVDGIGGHNLLEASAHGIPVIHGPYMKAQPDMVRILSAAGAVKKVPPDELARQVILLLEHPDEAREIGARGRQAYTDNRGSALRNMEMLKQSLESKK